LKTATDGLRRIASGRLFQARGAATAKARSPIVVRRVAGTMSSVVVLGLGLEGQVLVNNTDDEIGR